MRVALISLMVIPLAAGCGNKSGPSLRDTDSAVADNDDTHAPTPCADWALDFEEQAAAMSTWMEDNGVPGGAMAIVCDGQLAFSKGIGTVRKGTDEPVTGATRFQLASMTKMFTAALGMKLDDRGTVDRTAPLATILPHVNDTAPFDTPMTLHHLMSHTAGYPTTNSAGGSVSTADLAVYFDGHREETLWSPPGAVFNYSNVGMSLAGLALQQADGRPFGTLVEEEIFSPAGMVHASMDAGQVESEGNFAFGHNGSVTSTTVVAPTDGYLATGYYGPMGGAWASAEDLARWALVHLEAGGDVMSEAAMAEVQRGRSPTGRLPGQQTGYGLFMDSIHGTPVWSHNGIVGGYWGNWVLLPEEGFGVFVVFNASWAWPGEVTDGVLEHFGLVEGIDPGAHQFDENWAADFPGTYEAAYWGTMEVTATPSGLEINLPDRGFSSAMTGYYDGYSLFTDSEQGRTVPAIFWREGDTGPAKYLVTSSGVGRRVE